MLDFSLSDPQAATVEAARRFAHETLLPLVEEADRVGRFPSQVLPEAHRLGLLNATLPPKYGGLGQGHLGNVLVTEPLGWACTGLTASIIGNALPSTAIALAGSEDQKKHYFGQLAAEPVLASFCVTERHAGSDVSAITTRLRDSNTEVVLHGEKAWITNAPQARFYVVFATADPSRRHRGLAALIVDRHLQGVSVQPPEDKLGQRASESAVVRFDEVHVPRKNLLAPPGHGFQLAMQTLSATRASTAAMASGLIQRCLDECVAYSRNRVAFGVPIGQHQLIQAKLAQMAIDLETTRLLAFKAAWAIDRGDSAVPLSSYAKAFGAERAERAAADAVQIFGAHGYSRRGPVEKLLRDAKVLPIYEGTNEIQKLVIARHLLRQ